MSKGSSSSIGLHFRPVDFGPEGFAVLEVIHHPDLHTNSLSCSYAHQKQVHLCQQQALDHLPPLHIKNFNVGGGGGLGGLPPITTNP